MPLVLDASVAMRWLADDASAEDKAYAKQVLRIIIGDDVRPYVPSHWTLEIAHVLARSERRGSVTIDMSEYFLNTLSAITIVTDYETSALALNSILGLSRLYGLSSYDAAYLELALRLDCPMATLDKDLRRAAEKAGIVVL
jgi:predicted nucleic acid-binding protein